MILRTAGLLPRLAAVAMALATALATAATAAATPQEQTVLGKDAFARPAGNLPTLADLLTLEGRASIFYSYARETTMSARFTQMQTPGEEGGGADTTLFVPTNKAVQALARKPHEDPEVDVANLSDAEYEAISRSNVERWVGAHIIPRPDVDFTSSEPYNTLTAGVTITFHAVGIPPRPPMGAHPPIIHPDKASGQVCPYRRPARVESFVEPFKDSDAAHFASLKGESHDHGDMHLSSISQSTPIWKQYELFDGIRVIDRKQASNGVMYLIDGTVPV